MEIITEKGGLGLREVESPYGVKGIIDNFMEV